MTIVEFLQARLREDRRRAELAQRQRWDHPADAPWTRERLTIDKQGFSTPAQQMIATFADPARVLREVEAKRRILDDYERTHGYAQDPCCGRTVDRVIELLAQPYADHPDYDKSWQPA